jgi:hypothetical protein
MLDHSTHQQAVPLLATKLATSGATARENDDEDLQLGKSKTLEEPSMALKASEKEDRFMSHLNTPAYNITDDQALLCPARVRGFAFLEKMWAFFLVDKVQEIEWQPSAFQSLELDPRMKSAILALVETHRDDDAFDVSSISYLSYYETNDE